jgi:hypothetical protein
MNKTFQLCCFQVGCTASAAWRPGLIWLRRIPSAFGRIAAGLSGQFWGRPNGTGVRSRLVGSLFCLFLTATPAFAIGLADASKEGGGSPPASFELQHITRPELFRGLQTAVESIAYEAGISILIEGRPAQQPYTSRRPASPEGRVAVAQALTELAEAYDYSWEAPQPGVVLFRKRFSHQWVRPELPHAELRAWLTDLQTILGQVQSASQAVPGALAILRDLEKALPPDAVRNLAGEGVPISALPPALRELAGAG